MNPQEMVSVLMDLQQNMFNIGVKFMGTECAVGTRNLSEILASQNYKTVSASLREYNRHSHDGNEVFIAFSTPNRSEADFHTLKNSRERITFSSKRSGVSQNLVNSCYTSAATKHVMLLGEIGPSFAQEFAKAHPDKHCWFFGRTDLTFFLVPKVEISKEGIEISFETHYNQPKRHKKRCPTLQYVTKDGQMIDTGKTTLYVPRSRYQMHQENSKGTAASAAIIPTPTVQGDSGPSGAEIESLNPAAAPATELFDNSRFGTPIHAGAPATVTLSPFLDMLGHPAATSTAAGQRPEDDLDKDTSEQGFWRSFLGDPEIEIPKESWEKFWSEPLSGPSESEEVNKNSNSNSKKSRRI